MPFALAPSLNSKINCRMKSFVCCKRRGERKPARVFKNAYLGNALKSKGFKNRKTRIHWLILALILWKIGSMMVMAREEEKLKRKTA